MTVPIDMLHAAGVAILMILVWKLVDKGFDLIWKRTAGTDYVTKEDCKTCSRNAAATDSAVCKELKTIKEILYLVADKSGIDKDEIKRLIT